MTTDLQVYYLYSAFKARLPMASLWLRGPGLRLRLYSSSSPPPPTRSSVGRRKSSPLPFAERKRAAAHFRDALPLFAAEYEKVRRTQIAALNSHSAQWGTSNTYTSLVIGDACYHALSFNLRGRYSVRTDTDT